MAHNTKKTPPKPEAGPAPTVAELQAQLAAAQDQLKAAKAAAKKAVYLKVSAKKAISLYGLRRMPITMYVDEWATILGMAEQIAAFGEEHAAELSRKGDAQAQG